MQDYKNLKELMSHLRDEKVCQNYMEELRWGGTPVCPHCNHEKPYRLKNGKTFRCSNPDCKQNFTVTVGTVFEKSHISYSIWLAAIWLITGRKKGTSSCQLARDLGVRRLEWQVLEWNEPAINFYKKINSNFDSEWVNCKLTEEQIKNYKN